MHLPSLYEFGFSIAVIIALGWILKRSVDSEFGELDEDDIYRDM